MIVVELGFPSHIAGDFNCIDGSQERRGGRPFLNNIGAKEFMNFIS